MTRSICKDFWNCQDISLYYQAYSLMFQPSKLSLKNISKADGERKLECTMLMEKSQKSAF